MTRTLELAIAKASELPEADQERIGRDLLAYIKALAELRAELQIGIDELDAGLGQPLDVKDVIRRGKKRLGKSLGVPRPWRPLLGEMSTTSGTTMR